MLVNENITDSYISGKSHKDHFCLAMNEKQTALQLLLLQIQWNFWIEIARLDTLFDTKVRVDLSMR